MLDHNTEPGLTCRSARGPDGHPRGDAPDEMGGRHAVAALVASTL